MVWLQMAHVGQRPHIWDLLDFTAAEALHLLSLVEFTDLLNGCLPDALIRNAFVILRIVATARYLHFKSQSPSSRTNLRPCPPSTKKPWLRPLPMLAE